MNKTSIACALTGATPALAGFPIFSNQGFNSKNLLITVFCCFVVVLISKKK